MIQELDTVVLTHDIQEYGLKQGTWEPWCIVTKAAKDLKSNS